MSVRRKAQRELLEEYAPSLDIEKFLSESPILNRASAGGALGPFLILIFGLIVAAGYWLLIR